LLSTCSEIPGEVVRTTAELEVDVASPATTMSGTISKALMSDMVPPPHADYA
jgi:hypothetical protein